MPDESLEAQVGAALRQRGLKLVTAESCTGGLIGHWLTNVPGSSEYYLGGVISYAYEAKERLLGVRHATLAQAGAVSQETVIEMADGARRAFFADFAPETLLAVSVSGIAGPDGELPGKPVGLVWIGLSTPQGSRAWQFTWQGSRVENKEQSARQALQIVFDYVNGKVVFA